MEEPKSCIKPLSFCSGCFRALVPGEKIFVETLTNLRNPLIQGRTGVCFYCPVCEEDLNKRIASPHCEYSRVKDPVEITYR